MPCQRDMYWEIHAKHGIRHTRIILHSITLYYGAETAFYDLRADPYQSSPWEDLAPEILWYLGRILAVLSQRVRWQAPLSDSNTPIGLPVITLIPHRSICRLLP